MPPDVIQHNLCGIAYEIFLLKKLKLNLIQPLVLTSSLQEIQWVGGQVELHYEGTVIQIQKVRHSTG